MEKKGKSKQKLWRVGVGIGLAGGAVFALRYALSPPSRERLPEHLSPDAFATRLFPSRHGDLVFHEGGSGEPVVFLHAPAVGASSYEWSLVYPAIADHNHVYALDLLGFGESQKLPYMMTADQHVDSLAQFLQGVCGGRPATLVASGLGGGFAAMLASQHPELVSRLCLVMPTGLSEFGRRRVTMRAGLAAKLPLLNRFLYRNYLARRAAVRQWLERFAFANAARVSAEMVDAYTACAQQNNAEHAIYSLMTGRLSLPIESRLRMLPQPVLLVWGRESRFPPVEWAERYLELVPKCTLTIVDKAGLLLPLEAPRRMISILEQGLAGGIHVVES